MAGVARRVEENRDGHSGGSSCSAARVARNDQSGQNARFQVGLVPHAERTFTLRRLLQWPPTKAFQGNPASGDHPGNAQALKGIGDIRMSIRNRRRSASGGPNYDVEFALLGPDSIAMEIHRPASPAAEPNWPP